MNRLLKAGVEVQRLQEAFAVQGVTQPPGTFYIKRQAKTLPLLEQIAVELGTGFVGVR